MAQDTVPVAIWLAAHHLHDYEQAMWHTVQLLGDRDTLCAIVGGIVMLSAGKDTVPQEWINSVEYFETSPFRNG